MAPRSARAQRRGLVLWLCFAISCVLLLKRGDSSGALGQQSGTPAEYSSSLAEETSTSDKFGIVGGVHGEEFTHSEDTVGSSGLGYRHEDTLSSSTPKQSAVGSVSQPGKKAKKVKGNARAELLFDLECSSGSVAPSCPAQGVGPSRSLKVSPIEEVSKGALKARAHGSGGPSGCKEAWITALGNDGFLPAVLVLLHTIRKYATEDRDFVALVSSAVTQGVRERLAQEAVRVIVVDPFENNERARQLVSKSARYRSGYWVVKMFVWRFEEYSKMVYVDADMYVRQNTDSIFCAPTDPTIHSIAVTPRSSFDQNAGFNAGMFIYNPSEDVFNNIMKEFLALSQAEMLATSEQDFLNLHFKNRYNLIPIDYIMKHRRMVKERKLWDESRVHGYHMNGSPKPWEPQWKTACAYPKDHQKLVKSYEDFFVEWWQYYYEMIGIPIPADRSAYRLIPEHDPEHSFDAFAKGYKCPVDPK